MKIASFIARSILLSISVALRMLVILAAAAFAVYALFKVFGDEPVAIIFLLIVLFLPTLVFLYLNAIRAGLVALKASGPPNVKKLGMATFKLTRFNMMVNNLILTLVGLGGSVIFIKFGMPDLWLSLSTDFEIANLTNAEQAVETLGRLPSILPAFWALAVSISVGVIGTSSGAVAAVAAEDGPNHDAIWGVTRQFTPLFALTALLLLLPAIALMVAAGGPTAPLFPLLNQSPLFLAGVAFYLLWSICAICAGKALAYVRTVSEVEAERKKMHSDMLGQKLPTEDLRALRMARQDKAKLNVH